MLRMDRFGTKTTRKHSTGHGLCGAFAVIVAGAITTG
jgi:aerobic-type carbon monoxide dehydrogenase small subunit (CoxS/CutS family)